MFVSDPGEQRDRFAAELEEIVDSIRTLDDLRPRVRVARAPPPRLRRSRRALQGHGRRADRGLRDARSARPWTPDVEEAWRLAYNLTAETMMIGALGEEPSTATVADVGERAGELLAGFRRPASSTRSAGGC